MSEDWKGRHDTKIQLGWKQVYFTTLCHLNSSFYNVFAGAVPRIHAQSDFKITCKKDPAGRRPALNKVNRCPISLRSVRGFAGRPVSGCRVWDSSPACQGFQSALWSGWTERWRWFQDAWSLNPRRFWNYSKIKWKMPCNDSQNKIKHNEVQESG